MRFGRIISLRSRVIGRSRCHHRPAVFWKEIESFYAREGDDVKPVLLVLKPNHRRHPTQLQLWTCYRRIICSALAELLPTYTETVRRSRESNYMGVFFSLWRSTTEYETDGRSTNGSISCSVNLHSGCCAGNVNTHCSKRVYISRHRQSIYVDCRFPHMKAYRAGHACYTHRMQSALHSGYLSSFVPFSSLVSVHTKKIRTLCFHSRNKLHLLKLTNTCTYNRIREEGIRKQKNQKRWGRYITCI